MHDALQSPVNLFDFFHERVDAVASSQRDTISQNGIFYLSQLLATHGHTDALLAHLQGQGIEAQALATPYGEMEEG